MNLARGYGIVGFCRVSGDTNIPNKMTQIYKTSPLYKITKRKNDTKLYNKDLVYDTKIPNNLSAN